ncbi:MAG TPA: aminotransferase class I/II-fold pyridoxal phosphate-dependent enzyme [Planctomycetes bacterium]|nr:aminotransferase class I/II-fold pyridoxal phosphate-dependent enzyme [Planctomycetota bacterium]
MQSVEARTSPFESRLVPASAARPGDDPIFALNAQAQGRAASGESILNSTLGALMTDEGRLAILPTVFEAFRRVPAERAAAYAPISGDREFLDAVIGDLFGDSRLSAMAVAAATPGGTGACHHAIVNFLEPGQKLLTSSYYWGPYAILADHTRRGLETFSMFAQDGSFDVDAMETAIDRLIDEQGRVLLFLNTPCHNPTGFSLDDGDWERIVAVLERAGQRAPVTLLLDLAYAKFARPDSIRWPRYVERLAGKVGLLFAWTASKGFAQYGSRVGALIAIESDPVERDRIRNAIGYSCRGTWSNCNHLGMLAITEVLTDPELRSRCDAERDELRRLLDERVDVFQDLAKKAGLRYPRYEGGFFVAVFTPDAEATCTHMRERGVYVVPLDGAVRIALCCTRVADLPRLVDALVAGIPPA